MKPWAQKQKAFTIVELLIVIVVIAILAAISVAAYNGIQTRANNTQTISAVKEFVKAYAAYATDNGDYPPYSGCFGTGYVGNRCLSQSGVADCWSAGGSNGTNVNTALAPYMGNKVPSPSMQVASCGAGSYVGAYGGYNVATKTVFVYMILKGDQTCPSMSPNVSASSKQFSVEATLCRYTLQAV